MGCRQAVRHQTLTLASVGSNPAIPAKNTKAKAFVFFICAAGTTSFAWHTQHHLTVRSKSLPLAAQMNDVALRANDVLRNDVGLRPMMLRFAQTELSVCSVC